MYALNANFYPAQEPKNGYVGKAQLTIGDAVRIKDISVFQNEEGRVTLDLGEFGPEDRPRKYFVVPRKDGELDEDYSARHTAVYGAMIDVIKKAMENEKNFGVTGGRNIYSADLSISGSAVQEPYADGRYSLYIDGFGALNGIASHVAKDKEGEEFVSVDMPVLRNQDGSVRLYTNKADKEVADHKFFGVKSTRKDKEGKEYTVDYGRVVEGKVLACRKEFEKTLDAQINGAKARNAGEKAQDAPVRDDQSR